MDIKRDGDLWLVDGVQCVRLNESPVGYKVPLNGSHLPAVFRKEFVKDVLVKLGLNRHHAAPLDRSIAPYIEGQIFGVIANLKRPNLIMTDEGFEKIYTEKSLPSCLDSF